MTTLQFDNGHAEVHSTHAYVFVGGQFPAVAYDAARNRWLPGGEAMGSPWPSRSLSASEAAIRVGATESFIRQVERAAASLSEAAKAAMRERLEAGRRSWRAKSQAERDALNQYAMETEGHTID